MLITDEADAFDGMDRQLAEIALHEMGLRGKWWILESNMTARQQVRVDVNGTLSEPYNRTGGAAQGAVLTPTKYSAVKSYLQERLEHWNMGVKVGDTCIVGVSYADDGATLEETELGMNRVLAEFEKESRDIGNRYRQKDQRILVFGPYRPKGKDWKMGNINIEKQNK